MTTRTRLHFRPKSVTSLLPTQLSFCLTLLACIGCAGTAPASRTVYEDEDRFVRLEVTSRASREGHSHPATVSQENLARLIKSMTVTPRLTSPQGPLDYAPSPKIPEGSRAFSDETAEFLSIYLSQALSKATPLEEVLFFLSATRSGHVREITSGGFYVESGSLHLLLANYRHPTFGQFEIRETQAAPLKALGQAAYELHPGSFGRTKPATGLVSVLTRLPEHLIFDYGASLHPLLPVPEKESASPQKPQSPGSTIADKLRELESLREEGLISEQEFRELRKKLLETF
jgi:hypothetical protein